MKTRLFSFLLLFCQITVWAQVQVNLNILPPYSTRLSDYANHPGKMLVTLQNTGTTTLEVYLRAEIRGENGIRIFTAADYRPTQSITLSPRVPYVLNVAEIQTLFSADDLTTRGTTLRDIERMNGLPEGSYEVCVRAFDFNQPSRPLSPDRPTGCRQIQMSLSEPPILIKPLRDETVQVTTAQNVLFSWTQPAGLAPGTKYILKVVEMFDEDRNPNDAFLSSPPFFEKEVTGNVYLMGPADPALVHNRRYAWAVQAVSEEEMAMRNAGRSEVRSFKVNQLQIGYNNPEIATIAPLPSFSLIHLKGKLRYFWMTASVGSANSTLQFQNPTPVSASVFNNYQNSPLAGVTVHLVEAFQFQNPQTAGNLGAVGSLLPGNIITYAPLGSSHSLRTENNPLATAVTDAQGNFNFHFPALENYDFTYKMVNIQLGSGEFNASISGMARKVLMVKIGTGGASWYAHPIQFHDSKSSDMGTFYAKVKTFNPTIEVADKNNPNLVKDGVEVIIVRKSPRPTLVPKDEGNPGNFSPKETFGVWNYEVVAKGVTDASGRVNFRNIVLYYCNNNESPYLVFVRPKNEYSTSHSFNAVYFNGYPLRYARESQFNGECYNNSLYNLNESCYQENCFYGLTMSNAQTWALPLVNSSFDNFNRVPISTWHPRIYATVKNRHAGTQGELGLNEPGVSWYLWKVGLQGAQDAHSLVGTLGGSPGKWGAYVETGSQGFTSLFLHLLQRNHPMSLTRSGVTGEDGRINAEDLPVEYSGGQQKGYFYLLVLSKNGFHSNYTAVNRIATTGGVVGDMNPALMGNAYNAGIKFMKPKGNLQIRLKGEDGPLLSGKVFYYDPETGQNGDMVDIYANGEYKNVVVPTGNNIRIVVLPTNKEKYQTDTLHFPITENMQKEIIVPLKIHRIHFKINGYLHNAIAGAKIKLVNLPPGSATFYPNIKSSHLYEGTSSPVQHFPTSGNNQDGGVPNLQSTSTPEIIGPTQKITNEAGRAEFAFSNSSNGPFIFHISGPQGGGFVQVEKNVMNPSGKEWQIVNVTLRKGRKVSGRVTVGESPVANARVRVKNSSPLIETFTNDAGEYMLENVPADINLTFTASKGGSGLVGLEYTEGRENEVKYGKIYAQHAQSYQTTINFDLRIYDDMDIRALLGFPMEVTQLTEVGSTVRVNALLTLPQQGWVTTNELLQIDDITLIKDSKLNEDHVPYARPQTLPFVLPLPELPVLVHQSYAGDLTELRLNRLGSQGTGVIQAKIGIRSISFNDPNFQFENKMYLKEKSGQMLMNSFSSGPIASFIQDIIPCNASGGNFEFKLVYTGEFSATALGAGSKFSANSVLLDTRIKTQVQNMGDLNLPAGILTIGNDKKLKPFANTIQHTVNLQQFKLDLTKITGNNAGIFLGGKVRALGLEMPFQNATLYPDRLHINTLEIEQLMLPGNIPLTVSSQARFGYEATPGRWYLAVLPPEIGNYAARIRGQHLQVTRPEDHLDFTSLWFYSDGNKEFFIVPAPAPFKVRNITDFYVQGVEVTETTFAINGLLELGIPELPAYQTGLMYHGNSQFTLRPFNMPNAVIQGVRLKFVQPSITLTNGKFEVKGNLENEDPDIFKNIDFTLTKTNGPSGTQVKIDEPPQGQNMYLGGESNSRIIVSQLKGLMKVADGMWSTLKFTGNMPVEMGFSPGSNTLNFEAIGGLSVNASTVKLENMETPFGELTMLYDLARHRLLGQLNYTGQLASMDVEADIEFAVDKYGYYFLSAARMEMSNPKVAARGFLLMGDYLHKKSDRQQAIESILKEYSYYYRFLNELPKGYLQIDMLNGFFLEAGAEIPFPVIPNFDIDLVVVSARLEVTIGGDVRLGVNFGNVNSYNMGMSVFVNAEFGLGASVLIACAGVEAKASAGINMDGTYYSNDTYLLEVGGFINITGSAYYGGGVGCDSDCDGPLCDKSTASGSIGLAAIGTITHQNSSFELRVNSNSFK
jgi:TANFOR domain-containing protein